MAQIMALTRETKGDQYYKHGICRHSINVLKEIANSSKILPIDVFCGAYSLCYHPFFSSRYVFPKRQLHEDATDAVVCVQFFYDLHNIFCSCIDRDVDMAEFNANLFSSLRFHSNIGTGVWTITSLDDG